MYNLVCKIHNVQSGSVIVAVNMDYATDCLMPNVSRNTYIYAYIYASRNAYIININRRDDLQKIRS